MVAIPWPVSTSPGSQTAEAAGRLINAFAEQLGEGARSSFAIKRVPGLVTWGTSTEAHYRGGILVGSTLFAAFEDEVVYYDSNGGEPQVAGSLSGDARVWFARNNKRPVPDVLVLSSGDLFTVTTSAVTNLNDEDVPSASGICFLGGYFFVTVLDGRCFASGLNATTFNSNDFITTESKAGLLYRPIPWGDQLFLCKSNNIEVWAANPVNDTGFPFNRVTVIQRGIIGASAIAGHEDGFGKALIFVGDDCAVHAMNGYAPVRISPSALDRLIENVEDKSTLEASVYIADGHPRWVLSCADWTWEYNVNTKVWNERESYGARRWRATQSVNAFGKWLVGDVGKSGILAVESAAKDEVGNPLVFEVWSAPVQKFPSRIRVSGMHLDYAVGVGEATGLDPIATNPVTEISWSDDGGWTFNNPRHRPLGRQAKGRTRVRVNQCGLTGPQGRIVKARVSDPVHVSLMGGEMFAAETGG